MGHRHTEAQLWAIAEIDHNLQIIACAGLGKTRVVAERVLHILPETGGAYTLKKYVSEKEPDQDGELRNFRITLKLLNAAFEPIVLTSEFEHDVQVIAGLRTVLG